MLISPEALERNRRAHERTGPVGPHKLPYGAFGHRWADTVLEFAARAGAKSVLDYGAGKGLLEQAIAGRLAVQSYDPVTFPARPRKADLVFCSDVLPFVEPEFQRPVMEKIRDLARRAVLFIVPHHPPHKMEGAISSITNRSLDEWQAMLAEVFPAHGALVIQATTPRLRFFARVDVAA